MTPEDFARIRAFYDRVMELPTSSRRAFVDQQVHPDDPIRSQLLMMVEAGDDSTFLTSGVLDRVPPVDDDLPSQIGNYKILRRLGKGGMGVVFLALRNDDVFHKVVTLKVIGDISDSPELKLVQRFKQERQILAGLEHPNIARILDGGHMENGRPFFVMEYIAGPPIDEYCTRMNADVATRVRMMAQVCDAVEYLHQNAVVHRDIKPQNILVTQDGQPKLVDFGIAKVETIRGVWSSTLHGAEPTMIMTPSYASPEQMSGDSSGKSGDIYSVAVVLYELLTGHLPYAGPDGRPDSTAKLSGKPPLPPSKQIARSPRSAANVPDIGRVSLRDLDHVVLAALQRDPRQRYGSAQLFGDDLRRCLDGRPITARPQTITYTARKAISRNPVTSAVAAAAVVIALMGGWMVADAYLERVELRAKEAQLAQFVAMLGEKVANWPGGNASANDKVADIRAANDLMASDTVRTLAEHAPDPPRVKQLIDELRGVLDRADAASPEEPALRREIATVYRRIGDVESGAPLAAIADKQQAANSYRRAAVIAADLRKVDGSWANQQINELSGLLDGLGAPLEAAVVQVPPVEQGPPVEARDPSPAFQPSRGAPSPRPAPTQTAGIVPVPEVDPQAKAGVEQRLRSTTADAERARRSFETLRSSLATRGQTVRGDVEGLLTEIDRLIDESRGLLEQNDLENAEDYLRRASYQLKRVFQTVGG